MLREERDKREGVIVREQVRVDRNRKREREREREREMEREENKGESDRKNIAYVVQVIE